MKDLLKQGAILFLMGCVIVAGMKAADWLLPSPERVLYVCIVDDIVETECKTLDELKAEGQGVFL